MTPTFSTARLCCRRPAAPSDPVCAGQQREQIGEALPALPGADEAAPVRDGEIDRRKRARAQDRACDNDARGGLLIDHEIGADREHAGLQHHAQHLGRRSEAARDVAGARWLARYLVLAALQSAAMRPVIPIGRQNFGVAPARLGKRLRAVA